MLQAYLNIIYFGRGAYGISAASKAYFDKPVEQLTVAEGALLAALIRRPSTLDPAVDPEGAHARWNWVLDGMVETKALSPNDRAAQVFPETVPPDLARAENQTKGPNGLIERQVTRELLELFNIDEQTLNTQGLVVTTTIDPQAQRAAEKAVAKYLDGQDPDMRAAVVSIDPHNGAVRAYYGGDNANGFDFAQAGLQTGSSFKVFALVAALEQGIGLGYQVDSSPLTVDGIKITNVEGEGCGTCNIAEALKMSLNTSYYRLMLKLNGGPQAVADAAHQAGIASSFPGVAHTLSEDGKGGPPNNGIVLGQYQTRVIDMASAYATLAASGIYHPPHFVQKVVSANGQVLFDASTADNTGDQRIPKAVADNVTAAMEPIAGYSRGHNLAGGRDSAAKTGTTQFGDTTANKDAWMVGYTPSLSTAVWVGTVKGDEPLVTASGAAIYGSGLPSDIWKATMDGALKGVERDFPQTDRGRWLCRCAAAAAAVGGTTFGDRHPAHGRNCAGDYHPDRSPTTITLAPPPPAPARCDSHAAAVTGALSQSSNISPLPLAADLRSADNRDCPSRTDVLGAALANVVGGPVGRHALIGRTRLMTPLRVMFAIALVFLALGWSTKAACLQSTGTGPGDQRVANWDNQRAYYQLCYSDTVPLYGAELLSQGKFPYKSSWIETDSNGTPQLRYDGQIAVRYMEYPVLTGIYQYLSMAIAKTYTALSKVAPPGGCRSGDVLQRRRVRFGAGVADNRLGDLGPGRPPDMGCGAGGRLTAGDLSDIHQFRCAGNGFGDEWAAGLGAAQTGACRCADRVGLRGETVSAVVLVPVVAAGHPGRSPECSGPHHGGRGGDLVVGESAGDAALSARLVGVLPAQHPARRRHGLVVQRRQVVHRLAWLRPHPGLLGAAAGAEHGCHALVRVMLCGNCLHRAHRTPPAARGAADFLDGGQLPVGQQGVESPVLALAGAAGRAGFAAPPDLAGVDDDRRVGVGAADVLPIRQPEPLAARAVVHHDGVAA